MKGIYLFILALISFVSLLVYAVCLTIEEQNHRDEMLGKKVVIQKDTLMILEYSGSNNCYLLSNKASIDCDLADKLVIKEK